MCLDEIVFGLMVFGQCVNFILSHVETTWDTGVYPFLAFWCNPEGLWHWWHISDILWALRCDRIDRWSVSIQSKSLLSCVGLGARELVRPMAHGMCVTWITKVSSGTPQTHTPLYLSAGLIPVRLPHLPSLCQSAENICVCVCDPWFNEAIKLGTCWVCVCVFVCVFFYTILSDHSCPSLHCSQFPFPPCPLPKIHFSFSFLQGWAGLPEITTEYSKIHKA